jgi:hypothetical protein
MKKELSIFCDKYMKAILNDNAAIFAGAGLSSGVGMVNWKELLRGVADELNLNVDKENDLIALAQYYKNEHGGRAYINEKLIEEFTKDVMLSENHKILATLPIKIYWTTNYDDLIEKSLKENHKIVDVKICAQNLSTITPQRDVIVYKMHGDVTLPHEAVLTKDDYEGYNEKRQLFTIALQGDLVSKTFLFIGFSFDDPNLEFILSRIRILLGENEREHYCFFKKVSKEGITDEEYTYEKTRQELKIKDLKRYSINAILIDSYEEITEVLKMIQSKLRRKNIFMSGAAEKYDPWNKIDAEKLIFNLSKSLIKENYRIISGFGLGVGSSVINGVLSHVYDSDNRHIDYYLTLWPFPQNIEDEVERKRLWHKYRKDMLSEAGIAIFIFGNKYEEGNIIDSDGLLEEFEIAVSNNIKVIPIGCTGYVSEKLWEKVMKDARIYYQDNGDLIDTIEQLAMKTKNSADIIKLVLKAVNLMQNII